MKINTLQSYIDESFTIGDGNRCWILRDKSLPVVKLDILVHTGRYQESKKLTSRTVAALCKEGTVSFTSKQIAEKLDYYGISMKNPIYMDATQFSFYALSKNLIQIKELIKELIYNPIFPTTELEIFKNRWMERLRIDAKKNDIVAYREFTSMLYGKDHPYGYNSNEKILKDITKADLAHYHKQNFRSGIDIIISGNVTDKIVDAVRSIIKPAEVKDENAAREQDIITEIGEKKIEVEGSSQTAIRLGKILPQELRDSGEEMAQFSIMNTILGGYFGSRLMANIRENKGYSYGVYSNIEKLKRSTFLSIACETDQKNVEKTIVEINKEVSKIKTELVGEKELDMVKNYIKGTLLQNTDGKLKTSEILKDYLIEGTDEKYFNVEIEIINSINSKGIRDSAEKYLQGDWSTVVIS